MAAGFFKSFINLSPSAGPLFCPVKHATIHTYEERPMTDKTPKTQRPKAQMEARADAPDWFGVDPRVLAKRQAAKKDEKATQQND